MKRPYKLQKIEDFFYKLRHDPPMKVPAHLYINETLLSRLLEGSKKKESQWDALLQLQRVCMLPGIESYALGMADIHPGYGFPIGGVGAFNLDEGLICVGGIGFDCNCGVRAMHIPVSRQEIERNKRALAEGLASRIPAGLGKKGRISFSHSDLNKILSQGIPWLVTKGWGTERDIEYTEDNGCLPHADPSLVSDLAKKRQINEMGTLGSGNHYLEVLFIDKIFDEKTAVQWNLNSESVVAFIHCGSRALGHQVGMDYIRSFRKALPRYNLDLPHMDLIGLPFASKEGQNYYQAMQAAMNCGFANRHLLMHLMREVFSDIFHLPANHITTLYDVGHNNAKVEKHNVNGQLKKLLVHRKGSTRSLPPGHPLLPASYRTTGQPVLAGGSMGTFSYILSGADTENKSFHSSIHGAGRVLSRKEAKNSPNTDTLWKDLARDNIILKASSKKGVLEEIPAAYKDINSVVEIMCQAGINRKVARLKPAICIKG